MMMRFWLIFLAAGLIVSAVWAKTVTVVVQEAQVKKRPQFYSSSMGKLHLGDRLEVETPQDGWYQVSFKDQPGWVHQSAVTSKSSHVSAGDWQGGSETTAEEVTLAGKGFNETVERDYRSAHPDLDFTAVDAMAARTVSDSELAGFAEKGGLAGEVSR